MILQKKNNLTRVLAYVNPLIHIIRGIETDAKNPLNDIDAVFDLKEYLNIGGSKKKNQKKRKTNRNK